MKRDEREEGRVSGPVLGYLVAAVALLVMLMA